MKNSKPQSEVGKDIEGWRKQITSILESPLAKSGEMIGASDLVEELVTLLSNYRQSLLTEVKEKMPKKSVKELLSTMGEAYKDMSVQVAYKEGYNQKINEVLADLSAE